MLTEIWEKICGCDAWVEVQARVVESHVKEVDLFGSEKLKLETGGAYSDSVIRIAWSDQAGSSQSAEIRAPEDSPLFQLIEGDSLTIKINPQKPDEFYVRGLGQDQAVSVLKRAVFGVVVIAVGILVWFGPDLVMAFSKK